MPRQKEIKFEQPSFLLLFFNKRISFIIVFLVLFILIGGYLFLFVPKISSIKAIKEDNTATEVKRSKNVKILEQVKDLEDKYNKIKKDRQAALDDFNKLIPNEPQVAELFVMLEKIALDNDFTLNSITVTSEDDIDNNEIKEANINISVAHNLESEDEELDLRGIDGALAVDSIILEEKEIKSSYESFKQFLTALENNLRLMDISTVSFGSLPVGEDGGAVGGTSFTFTLTTYFR